MIEKQKIDLFIVTQNVTINSDEVDSQGWVVTMAISCLEVDKRVWYLKSGMCGFFVCLFFSWGAPATALKLISSDKKGRCLIPCQFIIPRLVQYRPSCQWDFSSGFMVKSVWQTLGRDG